jgi:hypothetical protein
MTDESCEAVQTFPVGPEERPLRVVLLVMVHAANPFRQFQTRTHHIQTGTSL